MEEKIMAMLAKMDEKMDAKMEKIYEKMDARNKEMDEKMDTKLEKMGSRIEEVNGKMEMMDTKIDKQKDDIITGLSEKFQKKVEANKNEIEEIREEMNVKTNLENMENIVGRNMMAMEYQLKSELEKSVECIEDRMEHKMKKFEKMMRTAATTSLYNVVSTPRIIQSATYDGQTPWSSYKQQFEAAATANLWEEEQKATALVIALRGAALEILQTLSEEDRNRWSALTAALELRFGYEHLRQVFAAQVKTRTQKDGGVPSRI
ncbi:hypothetical protein Zmor_015489 [Zophobas morio]|uniref:Uncharacterized protein n=1 Tax=Zophobas morio TaxID=2755281 RepID=A0AA38MHR8_9CUCU|nr:hypothetical protein Zmor_015489 [Zophobas morio]